MLVSVLFKSCLFSFLNVLFVGVSRVNCLFSWRLWLILFVFRVVIKKENVYLGYMYFVNNKDVVNNFIV